MVVRLTLFKIDGDDPLTPCRSLWWSTVVRLRFSGCFPSIPLCHLHLHPSLLVLFKWEKATPRQKSSYWEPSLGEPPVLLFCWWYLPTEDTQLGQAVNSNEPAVFVYTKLIH